ncbi:imidazole glycerol phosphate synthase subunit HisH [Pollutimonas bauzanensis]|uniref:Imidazole glycerol phosphate synthase subunit HisH n=1 Tax=Pollutimonas bauzanensis TaxID=658167 RepID=A0A1M5YX82_9BURK|nr:imidazole glycerol phosphate synthase subunit HisH [Pollutimonas bauzanensis]SHI16656.1 glutamine amidotransferase [Pollutimonas bauzanensis]
MPEIAVLDYGAGNISSVIRMIERAGGQAQRASTPAEIAAAAKLVIPGVGAFDHGMSQLESRGLMAGLAEAALDKAIPVLGICLGMQLMCRASEEGRMAGLGWIDAQVRRFPARDGLRVPHMGWNTVRVARSNPLLGPGPDEKRFYFVHSYYIACNQPGDPIALTNYGEEFVAAFQRGNLFGVQFHPEKSHRYGMDLIRNFVELPIA